MTDWLLAQQGVLSISLAFLLIAERYTHKLGTFFTYRLWLLVPLALLMNNLPNALTSVGNASLSKFVVNVKPEATIQHVDLVLYIWLLGAGFIALYAAVQYSALHASLVKSDTKYPSIFYSTKINTPMLFGFLVPKIVLPQRFEQIFSQAQQNMILEHELTHQKHGDHLWNGLALIAVTVFWFNPLTWLALRAFRVNQELACDKKVLANKTSEETLIYAKALVVSAEQHPQTVSLYPTFGEKTTMQKRLMLMKNKANPNKLVTLTSTLLAALLMVNTAMANMPPPPPKTEKNNSEINAAPPVKRVSPIYPEQAVKENQEGFVVLQFDITEQGTTDNVTIVKSSPDGIFDESARTALKQWEYKPRIKGGKAMRQTGLLVQLDYKLGPDQAQ